MPANGRRAYGRRTNARRSRKPCRNQPAQPPRQARPLLPIGCGLRIVMATRLLSSAPRTAARFSASDLSAPAKWALITVGNTVRLPRNWLGCTLLASPSTTTSSPAICPACCASPCSCSSSLAITPAHLVRDVCHGRRGPAHVARPAQRPLHQVVDPLAALLRRPYHDLMSRLTNDMETSTWC